MSRLYPERVRLPRAEKLLAWGAAVVGAIGFVSALTPEMANRVEIVQGVLPPGWPEAARVLTVAFGIGLIWLSRSLAKRRRRAWQLAVAVVLASAAAHHAKGLDIEEATVSLLLLVALLRWRRPQLERDLAEELDFHRSLKHKQNTATGLSADDAADPVVALRHRGAVVLGVIPGRDDDRQAWQRP